MLLACDGQKKVHDHDYTLLKQLCYGQKDYTD